MQTMQLGDIDTLSVEAEPQPNVATRKQTTTIRQPS